MLQQADETKIILGPIPHSNTVRCVRCHRPAIGSVTFYKAEDGLVCEDCKPFVLLIKKGKK